MFSIGVTCRQGNDFSVHRSDGLIKSTIIAVILDFFSKHEDEVILYFCLTDGFQRERKITFGRWFHELAASSFEKHDCHPEYYKHGLYSSIILKSGNTSKQVFIEGFHNTLARWFSS